MHVYDNVKKVAEVTQRGVQSSAASALPATALSGWTPLAKSAAFCDNKSRCFLQKEAHSR